MAKVRPAIVENQKLPEGKRGKDLWEDRYEDINAFKRHLVRNGTVRMPDTAGGTPTILHTHRSFEDVKVRCLLY